MGGLMPIPWAKQSAHDKSGKATLEQLVNCYAEANPPDSETPSKVLSCPGLRPWFEFGAGPVRGMALLVGKLMVNVPYYCMVNILAKKELVPELMQHDFNATNVAARVEYLLDHPEAREEMVRGFQALRLRLGRGGAIERAADAIVGVLQSYQATRKAA